jgi:5-methyltetrahydrofolate--homocysteine methyltransferase
MNQIEQVREAVIDGDARGTVARIEAALAEGVDPEAILRDGLISGMREVGQLYESGEYFVPEMLISARAMSAALVVLRPRLASEGVESSGKVVIGTVHGDLHDIGKSLVVMMLEGAGFEVVDLGIDVPPERFVEAVRAESPQLVALSALLTTTMMNMGKVIEALAAAGVRDGVKVMIGGAPISQSFADQIGADGYSADAASAPALAGRLVSALGA